MFSAALTLKVSNGSSDLLATLQAVEKAAQPTIGDCLYAGQRQRSRVLDRTQRGVDVNGAAFAPYSKKGPYYYYPSKNAKNRRAGVTRFARKLGVKKSQITRLGIKFANYAAFKTSLGRTNVDLRGPSAPHMLQALIVKVAGVRLPGVSEFAHSLSEDALSQAGADNETPANEIVLGIYGEEALRASGHNEGAKHLPKRKFLGASDSDKMMVLEDILARVAFRVRKALGGGK